LSGIFPNFWKFLGVLKKYSKLFKNFLDFQEFLGKFRFLGTFWNFRNFKKIRGALKISGIHDWTSKLLYLKIEKEPITRMRATQRICKLNPKS
jgi:hypothetical protein